MDERRAVTILRCEAVELTAARDKHTHAAEDARRLAASCAERLADVELALRQLGAGELVEELPEKAVNRPSLKGCF